MDVDLHTGYATLSSAFTPRHLAIRFLDQQAANLDSLQRSTLLKSSVFFALWSNTFPDLLVSQHLEALEVEGPPSKAGADIPVEEQTLIVGSLASYSLRLLT